MFVHLCCRIAASCALAACYPDYESDWHPLSIGSNGIFMLTRSLIPFHQSSLLPAPNAGCMVELRRSPRAKRFSLKVSHTERAAILTLPPRGRVEDASAFLERHSDWLKRQLERLPDPVPFVDGAVVPFRGNFFVLKFASACETGGVVSILDGKVGHALTQPSEISIWSKPWCWRGAEPLPSICVSGGPDYAPRRFCDWLRSCKT